MNRRVNVIGVGLTQLTQFGAATAYYELIAQACRLALQDARIDYRRVDSVYAGFVHGDSISGQRGVAELGLTGVPIINVGNHAASGSTALYLAREAIEHGVADCVLAVGFEHELPVAAAHRWRDAQSPVARHSQLVLDRPTNHSHIAVPLFAAAAREYLARYGTRMETLAMVAVKSREHAQANPFALLRQKLSLEQVLMAPQVCAPLTLPQCCLPACGAAAVLLCCDPFARKHGIGKPVLLAAQAMTTDLPSTFSEGSAIQAIGYDLGVAASRRVYEAAGIGPEEVDVCELQLAGARCQMLASPCNTTRALAALASSPSIAVTDST
ncbi:hypothetical protein D9M71_407880 [compost metagenome]